jgi:hypothetical protein
MADEEMGELEERCLIENCPKPWAEDAPGLCRDHYREWVAAVAARDAALEAAYGPRRMTDDEPQDDFNRRVDAVFARCKAGQRTPTVVRMIRAPDFLPHPDDQEDFASCLEDLKQILDRQLQQRADGVIRALRRGSA